MLYDTDECPAGCEVPVETVADALVEFLRTASRPPCLR
ncbi:MAG TPA: Imm1 family immunity protein [Amycolatopsis sp.]|nr:Imm1 family immunity protein [Amycolatopsis sp.]HKS48496.1 Imm1 family immunity protein [Amycolatopsis sp.]